MARQKQFWAARPFGYAEYEMLDVGQVIFIEVGAQRNDEKLIRLGLLREVGPKQSTVECGKCGARFLDDGHLLRHGNARHRRDPVEVGRSEIPGADAETAEALGKLHALEEQDKFAEETIPIDYSKTLASKQASQ